MDNSLKSNQNNPNLPKLYLDFDSMKEVFSSLSNGVTITDQYSNILYINQSFTDITGYSPNDVLGKNPGMLHSGRHHKKFYETMWHAITTTGKWTGEIWNRHKSGRIYPELLTITKIENTANNAFYYVAVFNDISFIKADEMKQYHLAYYDPLTKLPNRTLLQERFNTMNHTMTVLFMDLNKFKQVNDAYGHIVGDQLLQHFAKCLANCTCESDTISRVGGDEFIVLLPTMNTDKQIQVFCKRLQDSLKTPVCIDNHSITANVSIGAAYFPKEGKSFEEIINHADKAMYHAKQNQLSLSFYHNLT